MEPKFDEVGQWTEIKLEILRKYAQAYSTILSRQAQPRLDHFYIDGFSGAGTHLSKVSGEQLEGSPRIALQIDPPFRRYFFIDLNRDKLAFLRDSIGDRADVEILEEDCNQALLHSVFPRVQYEQYRRALCLLDPYGLQLDWEVVLAAGKSRAIDLFLNFPVMDMNRNALFRDADRATAEQKVRMTRFWGDDTWFDAAYDRSLQIGLFEGGDDWVKGTNETVVEAFRQRLRQVARFAYVPKPLPMRNSIGAVVYYLFFASQRPVGEDIVEQIFERYR